MSRWCSNGSRTRPRTPLSWSGPILLLQALPIRNPAVTVLYTDPVNGERARQLFENVMRQRLNRIGTSASVTLSSVEEEGAVTDALEHLLRAKPTVVLIASTSAPARPDDVIGCAWARAGGEIECFLALLASHRVSKWEVAGLGHGGLLI